MAEEQPNDKLVGAEAEDEKSASQTVGRDNSADDRTDADRAGRERADRERDCSAIVLAGGESLRFGTDKREVRVDGIKLLDRVVSVVALITPDLVVVGRPHETVVSVDDPEPRSGPLNAVSFALAFATRERALVVAGDHPFLQPGMLSLLVDSLEDHEAVVPVDRSGRPQPLVACYRKSLGPAMADAVEEGTLSIDGFLRGIDVLWLPAPAWERVDPNGMSFLDIDTVADFEMLKLETQKRLEETSDSGAPPGEQSEPRHLD